MIRERWGWDSADKINVIVPGSLKEENGVKEREEGAYG